MTERMHANCPYCGTAATLVDREFRVRRGDRVAPALLPTWECRTGCTNEAGVAPFRFATPSLASLERARMEVAWLETYGEALPAVTPPGRKPAEKRSVPVHVLLTPTELRLLDRLRGPRSRSEFIRGKALAG